MTYLSYASPVRVAPVTAPQRGQSEYADGAARTLPIAVYGNRWCGLTQMIGRALSRAGLDYEYVDLDEHPSVEQRLQMLTGGRLRTPVVYVDGQWLVAPSIGQLRTALMRAGAA